MTADYRLLALLSGIPAFAGGGALLSLLVCLAVRGALPGLSRRLVLAIVAASVPVLTILLLALARLAIEGRFSLTFVLDMRPELWLFLLAATVAGLLLARLLAPAPIKKVDPSVFE